MRYYSSKVFNSFDTYSEWLKTITDETILASVNILSDGTYAASGVTVYVTILNNKKEENENTN